ncbi:ricin-type beta-trefoil lectin domain protein [Kitasatospora sp. NPDC097643]|uniref:ricin-type beta-trefoil lectin domain protein n=1 Tax=Kitasatospora sp. NPDC097643 TaxID=3157230 RepID=UPI00332CA482
MRRSTALLTTALLAGAAALTAPATAAQADPACSVGVSGWSVVGRCTGLDPMQTWSVTANCYYWNADHTVQFSRPAWGGLAIGDGTASASCGIGDSVWFPRIVMGATPPAGPTGQITGYAGKCVDVKGANTGNGTPVQIYDCNGTWAQKWRIGVDGTIRALGKCMDVSGGGTGNATRVQIYDCNGTGAQQWQARPDGSLLNPQSGRCLDDLGFSTANGNQLGIWDCNGYDNQKWNLPTA